MLIFFLDLIIYNFYYHLELSFLSPNDSKNYVCGLHQKKNSSFNFVPVKKRVAMAKSRLRKYKAFLNPNSAWITRWAPSFIFNIFIII